MFVFSWKKVVWGSSYSLSSLSKVNILILKKNSTIIITLVHTTYIIRDRLLILIHEQHFNAVAGQGWELSVHFFLGNCYVNLSFSEFQNQVYWPGKCRHTRSLTLVWSCSLWTYTHIYSKIEIQLKQGQQSWKAKKWKYNVHIDSYVHTSTKTYSNYVQHLSKYILLLSIIGSIINRADPGVGALNPSLLRSN